jgi:hypothetical protein
MMMEYIGPPPLDLIKQYPKRDAFFFDDGRPREIPNRKGDVHRAGSKNLWKSMKTRDHGLLDFIAKCLSWRPTDRVTAFGGLNHYWVLDSKHIDNSI